MSKSKHGRRIEGRLSPDTHARFLRLKEREELTGKKSDEALLVRLLDCFEQGPATLHPADLLTQLYQISPRDYQEVIEALEEIQGDFWDMVRSAILRRVRELRTSQRKVANLEYAGKPVSGHGLAGVAHARIHRFVEDIMQHNCQAQHAMDVIYLTRKMVAHDIHADRTAVAQYFKTHAEELAAHYQALGIGSEQAGLHHNRLRQRYLARQQMEKDRVEVVNPKK